MANDKTKNNEVPEIKEDDKKVNEAAETAESECKKGKRAKKDKKEREPMSTGKKLGIGAAVTLAVVGLVKGAQLLFGKKGSEEEESTEE